MSVGKVSQQLYLTSLPDGGVFTVTAVSTPSDDTWYTYFSHTAPFSVTARRRSRDTSESR